MASQTEASTQAARKRHRCTWCWQFIEIGDQYARYRYYDGGDVGTVRMHPECHGAMQEEAADEGGFIEWTPGQPRPAIESNRATLKETK